MGRRAELQRIITGLMESMDEMDQWEQRFVTDMNDQLTMAVGWIPTPRQLFKARDLNVKY